MSSLYTIEKGIPLPKKSQAFTAASALDKMNVGDSFIAEREDQCNIHSMAKYRKMKVTTRTIDAETIRVWRIA